MLFQWALGIYKESITEPIPADTTSIKKESTGGHPEKPEVSSSSHIWEAYEAWN